jgi:hypothetical protein
LFVVQLFRHSSQTWSAGRAATATRRTHWRDAGVEVLGFSDRKGTYIMARDGNTYAKKARETLKRQKAQEKRERRLKRKEPGEAETGADASQPGDLAAASEPLT